MQHKEIPNKRNLQQTNSATGHTTLRLCKLNASNTTIIKYKNHAKSPNTAARLIPRRNVKESTMECLKTLHWLPIQQRKGYKICTLIHKCDTQQAPEYLQNLIEEKTTNHPSLRLENKKVLLAVSNIRKHTFTSRSFSIYGPNLWNSLHDRIREEIIFEKFKKKLKTHLFTTAYI